MNPTDNMEKARVPHYFSPAKEALIHAYYDKVKSSLEHLNMEEKNGKEKIGESDKTELPVVKPLATPDEPAKEIALKKTGVAADSNVDPGKTEPKEQKKREESVSNKTPEIPMAKLSPQVILKKEPVESISDTMKEARIPYFLSPAKEALIHAYMGKINK